MSLSAQFQAAVAFGPQGQYGVVADQAIMNRIMRDTTLGDAMTYTYDLADAADCYKYEQFVAQIGALLENNATLIVPVRRVVQFAALLTQNEDHFQDAMDAWPLLRNLEDSNAEPVTNPHIVRLFQEIRELRQPVPHILHSEDEFETAIRMAIVLRFVDVLTEAGVALGQEEQARTLGNAMADMVLGRNISAIAAQNIVDDALQRRIDSLEGQFASTRAENATIRAELSRYQNERSLNRQLAQSGDAQELQEQLINIRTQLKTQAAEFSAEKNKLLEQISGVEAQLQLAQAEDPRQQPVGEEATKYEKQNEGLRKAHREAKAIARRYKEERNAARARIQELEHQAVGALVQPSEADDNNYTQELTAIGQRLMSLTSDRDTALLGQVRQERDNIQGQLSEMTVERDDLQQQLTEQRERALEDNRTLRAKLDSDYQQRFTKELAVQERRCTERLNQVRKENQARLQALLPSLQGVVNAVEQQLSSAGERSGRNEQRDTVEKNAKRTAGTSLSPSANRALKMSMSEADLSTRRSGNSAMFEAPTPPAQQSLSSTLGERSVLPTIAESPRQPTAVDRAGSGASARTVSNTGMIWESERARRLTSNAESTNIVPVIATDPAVNSSGFQTRTAAELNIGYMPTNLPSYSFANSTSIVPPAQIGSTVTPSASTTINLRGSSTSIGDPRTASDNFSLSDNRNTVSVLPYTVSVVPRPSTVRERPSMGAFSTGRSSVGRPSSERPSTDDEGRPRMSRFQEYLRSMTKR